MTDGTPEPDQDFERLKVDCLRSQFGEEEDVVLAYLFGSSARQRADRLSDLDVAVLLDSPIDRQNYINRHADLISALSGCIDREIDLVFLGHAPPFLAYEVIRHGRLLYTRSNRAHRDFLVRTREAFFDYRHRLEQHSQATLTRIKEVGLGRGQRGYPGALETARRLHTSSEGDGNDQR